MCPQPNWPQNTCVFWTRLADAGGGAAGIAPAVITGSDARSTAVPAAAVTTSLRIKFLQPAAPTESAIGAPCPMVPMRGMPLPRPDIGRHVVRFRATPNRRSQHFPRVIPNRPMVPPPIVALMPLGIMNRAHRRAIAARGSQRARRRRSHGGRRIWPDAAHQGCSEHNGGNRGLRHKIPQRLTLARPSASQV